jgi:2-isopropylmalate synthase
MDFERREMAKGRRGDGVYEEGGRVGFSEIHKKYRAYPVLDLSDREWPGRTLERAPIWCSVDLRDGNQALVEPMGMERKLRMWDLLVGMGYKEIEVGFPSASRTDYDFLRHLIENDLIPEDVTIQVLTQARDHLIEKTVDSIRGARRVIVHLYNSTSKRQREVVFGLDRKGVIDVAVLGARKVCEEIGRCPEVEVIHQYSPESFTQTELDFSVEICSRVREVYGATPESKMIINLPATVEVTTPNVYADQIESFIRQVECRDSMIISLHTHNDRGCGVAATELGLLAGAERVEGTLFGNGERTGNVDLVTLGLNLTVQGIDSGIDFGNLSEKEEVCRYCTRLSVSVRHPYVGDLVYTAFSGSHQDAIGKGMKAMREGGGSWDVPYLLLDPEDVGANYEAVVRINSQSGKGGVAFVMEKDHGFRLPRGLQIDFSRVVQEVVDREEREMTSREMEVLFERTYVDRREPFCYEDHESKSLEEGFRLVEVKFLHMGKSETFSGEGTGPISVLFQGLLERTNQDLKLVDYVEHAIGEGDDTLAAAYVEVVDGEGESYFGVGKDRNSVKASLRAVVSAVNRAVGGV